jgi:hypothetical protein
MWAIKTYIPSSGQIWGEKNPDTLIRTILEKNLEPRRNPDRNGQGLSGQKPHLRDPGSPCIVGGPIDTFEDTCFMRTIRSRKEAKGFLQLS